MIAIKINKIGVHTILLSTKVTNITYNIFHYALTKYVNLEENKQKGCMIIPYDKNKELTTEEFEDLLFEIETQNINYAVPYSKKVILPYDGLTIILKEVHIFKESSDNTDISCDDDPNMYRLCFIQYIINPARLIGGSPLDIYTNRNMKAVIARVNKITTSVHKDLLKHKIISYIDTSETLPFIENMKIKRIDCCCNFFIGSSDIIKIYLDIFKQSFLYKGYEPEYLYAKHLPENSVMLRKGNVTAYIYDKKSELLDREKYGKKISVKLLEEADGIMRSEIRIENSRISAIMKKKKIAGTVDFLKNITEIAEYTFIHYCKKLFFSGDYRTYHAALSVIQQNENLNLHGKTKKHLIKIIEYVKKHGIVKGMDKFAREYELSDQQMGRLISHLNELNVNPVTLSKSQCRILKKHNINNLHLPNMIGFADSEIVLYN